MTGPSGWRTPVMLGMCGLFAAMIACEKTPLLAPTGSTLILTAPSTALSANSSVRVTAHVLEAAGTPPHSGTRVTFTTTLGNLQPAIAETDVNGMASVLFFAGNSNGSAKISASSGAASTGTDGVLTIAIGAGAAGRVTLTANPNIIQTNGGSSVISASVLDINGAALSGVTVSFATSAGALSTSVATTDAGGNAATVLTTTTQATVTATVGVGSGTGTGTGTGDGSTAGQASASVTVNVNAAPTVSVTPTTTGVLTAGTPITFAVTVQPPANSSAQIRSVTLNFGDGTSQDLGALTGTSIPQQHVYANSASVQSYIVRLSATDTLNATTSAATTVVIQPQPPLSVAFTFTRNVSGTDSLFTFTATVTPNTTTIQTFAWDFGDGTSAVTTSPQTTHTYSTGSGAKTVTVLVTATNGATASTSRSDIVP